ncbi:hypothetical protein CR513_12396, partial [Mucuna pruriens]
YSPSAGSSTLFQDDTDLSRPVSKFHPTIGLFTALLDILDDQKMVLFVALKSSRIPFSLSLRTPELLSRGVFRLATHTTYRLVEFPGLKKPTSIIPPADTKVSPSRID